jgi:hypothetical protein
LTCSTDEAWQTRYEHLRAQALQERGTSDHGGCGYALLLQRGLAAWMQAWPASPSPPLPEPMSTPAAAQDALALPWPIEQQLAHILADTILDHVQEIGS